MVISTIGPTLSAVTRTFSSRPLTSVVEQIAEQLVEILGFAGERDVRRDADLVGETLVGVELSERRDMIGNSRRKKCPRALGST